ncbi:MAG: YdcH family protein [Gammaproteobacteria bacterium]|nr:YdcH family protein [Gammaproteobacteria bacterium]
MAIISALATRQLPRTVATGLSHALAKSTGMRYNCSPSCLGCDVNSASGQVSLILFEAYRGARLGRALPTFGKRYCTAMSIAGLVARKFRPEIYTDPQPIRLAGRLSSQATRRFAMFEDQREKLEQLLKKNEEFRKLYNQHQQLEKRVLAAEYGTAPMENLALNQLKREKLRAKDQLTRIMEQAAAA